MTTHFPLSGPMSVGDLLDRAFRLYRARFGVFLLTAAIFLVPWTVVSILAREWLKQYVAWDVFGYEGLDSYIGAEMLLITLKTLTVNRIVALCLTTHCLQALHGNFLTFRGGIHQGLRRFWPYWSMSFLTRATLTVVALIPFIVGAILLENLVEDVLTIGANFIFYVVSLSNPYSHNSSLGKIVLALSGYSFLFILTFGLLIYLIARWLAAPSALIAEESGPLASLARSWWLSWGHIRRAIGYTFLLLVITALITSIPTVLIQVILLVATPVPPIALVMGLSTTVFMFFSIAGMPFYAGAAALFYYDLRIRRESCDLALRVAGLEEQVAQGTDLDTP